MSLNLAIGGSFARTRLNLAKSAQSAEMRQRVIRELSALSDRALLDIGIFRSDINTFARQASSIPGHEPLPQALMADLRALFRSRKRIGMARKPAA